MIRIILAMAILLFAAGPVMTATNQAIPPKIASALLKQKSKPATPTLSAISDSAVSLIPSLRTDFMYESDCTVYVDEPQNALYDWMTGIEIYYAYQDLFFPKVTCDTIYPYVVTHIGMTIVLNDAGTINVMVFVADVDPIFSSPICPVPGEIIYVGNEYPVEIPGPGVYSLVLALETPVPVYGPYFACMYFGSDMTAMYPGLALDTAAYLCITYNEWGEGLVDLASNDYYNFPGTVHLYSIGYAKGDMLPKLRFLVPSDSGVTYPGKTIWVGEANDALVYQGAAFEYFKSGVWYQFGADFDGSSPLRDGVTPATVGDGWSAVWQPFGLNEGTYLMRVTVADFDSTYTMDTASVYLDMKPLAPEFLNRTDLMSTCGAETVRVAIEDENPVAVTFGFRYLPNFEERTLQLLRRNDYGDANNNPSDGNHNYSGEFGEYYSAPTILTSFFKHWFDKGYIEVMAEGSTFLTTTQMAESLAVDFDTRDNLGTQDDNLAAGLIDYLKAHGNRIKPDIMPKPNWEWFKSTYLGRQATVMLAIDGPFGHWLAAQKVDFAASANDSFPVTYYDPVGGVLRSSFLIARGDSLVLGYLPNNKKYRAQLGVALYPKQEAITYSTFWTDFNTLDGFYGLLPTGTFQEDLLYLVRARALDANNDVADSYWIIKNNCTSPVVRGDADHTGMITISDAVYLISYIFASGPPPATLINGDADCTGSITISDAVFIITYIFASGPAPCP